MRPALATLRLTALGAIAGVATGAACWAFLEALDWATETRLTHGRLIWLLPAVGLAIGAAYHHLGGRSGGGNGLLLDEIHRPTEWVPRRMAPFVAVGTIASHLVGASVGREGTALQMSGSLTDLLARTFRLGHDERRVLLVAALGGGFAAVFGVPLAGTVFGLEVQRVAWYHAPSEHGPIRRWIHFGLPTLACAIVANQIVDVLGHHHPARPQLHPALDLPVLGRAALVGIAFGLAAALFIECTDIVRRLARRASWPPLRPALGGVLVLIGVAFAGRDYLGLSLPLISDALAGDHVAPSVPLLKLAFTVICIGCGFIGGEVTPLFVIGATLGSVAASAVGMDPVLGAELGFVAVFAGAVNTPVACTVMAAEVFGSGIIAPAAIACLVAYACSGQRGIYPTQRRRTADGTVSVEEVARWWPRARPPGSSLPLRGR